MAVFTIALLTLREASRRRLLIAVAILTLIVAVLSGWAFHRLVQLPCSGAGSAPCHGTELKLIAATLLILLMFMFSFILALGAAFLAAPSIANDIESGIALAMLPRPIRRSDVVLGKWLGLAILLALYAAISCGLEFVIGKIAFGYVPPHPVVAIGFLIAESLIVLTLTLADSTRIPAMAGGIIVLVLFGMTWIAGIAGTVGAAFHSSAIENVGKISSLILPTDGLWRGAIYNLEPVSIVIAQQSGGHAGSANPFFVSSPAATAYLVWVVAWIVAFLGLAVWSFERREL